MIAHNRYIYIYVCMFCLFLKLRSRDKQSLGIAHYKRHCAKVVQANFTIGDDLWIRRKSGELLNWAIDRKLIGNLVARNAVGAAHQVVNFALRPGGGRRLTLMMSF